MPVLNSCRKTIYSVLAIFFITGTISDLTAVPGSGIRNEADRNRLQLSSPNAIEMVEYDGVTSSLFDQLHHDHNHDQIIHVTDYLYRMPEIREAYERYLEMKEHQPDQLQAMMYDPVVYEVGDTLSFNVVNLERSGSSLVYDRILFELRAKGEKSEIWVEQDEYAPGKVDDNVVSVMMEALEDRTPPQSVNPDQGIILNNIDIFAQGNPSLIPDPDGSGIVKVLISDIQDGWDPQRGGGYTAGFFNPGDLSPGGNSNEAAILYINSFPGIYTNTQSPNPNRPLSTVAHEFQHLIQANRGNLITFMDEGQSEIAEIFNGFSARSMTFLNNPNEVSGNVDSEAGNGIFRWRRGETEVLRDYQRAQLFHSYMYERVGLENIGRLTQSLSGSPWTQYQRLLNRLEEGLEFRDILAQFYVANWLNDTDVEGGLYGYSRPQLSGVNINNPARRFDGNDRPWISNERVNLRYGSASYTHWLEAEDLRIYLNTPPEIAHHLITYGENGEVEVIRMDSPQLELDGFFRSVVLVSVNTVPSASGSYGTRNYQYSAEWTPSDLRIVEINYATAPQAGYLPLPMEQISSQVQAVLKGISVRVDPEVEGRLQNVEVLLGQSNDAVQGDGFMRTSITRSQNIGGSGNDARYIPDEVLATVVTDFDNLSPGPNTLDFSSFDLELDAGVNYNVFFQIELESNEGGVRFMLDQGSDSSGDRNYYPVRTLLTGIDENGEERWFRLLGDPDNPQDNDNKNLVLTTRVLSRIPVENDFPGMAVSDNFELLANYPNPFNERTNIRFNIPDSVDDTVPVRVDLFDVTGRRVATLVDGQLQAGVHTVPFGAGNLASGVYITRLRADDTVDVRKILLLK